MIFNKGIMSTTKHNNIWSGGNILKKGFKEVNYGFMIFGFIVFFYGASEARTGEEFDILTRFLIFLDKGFGAVGGDSVRCGHNEDIFCAGVRGDFNGWLGANEFNVRIFFAKIGDVTGGGGVTGDNNNFCTPVG